MNVPPSCSSGVMCIRQSNLTTLVPWVSNRCTAGSFSFSFSILSLTSWEERQETIDIMATSGLEQHQVEYESSGINLEEMQLLLSRPEKWMLQNSLNTRPVIWIMLDHCFDQVPCRDVLWRRVQLQIATPGSEIKARRGPNQVMNARLTSTCYPVQGVLARNDIALTP